MKSENFFGKGVFSFVAMFGLLFMQDARAEVKTFESAPPYSSTKAAACADVKKQASEFNNNFRSISGFGPCDCSAAPRLESDQTQYYICSVDAHYEEKKE